MRTSVAGQRLDRVLEALALARPYAPIKVSKYEARIRFSIAQLDQLRHPIGASPVRADRLVLARQILNQQANQAEAFLDLMALDIIGRRVG